MSFKWYSTYSYKYNPCLGDQQFFESLATFGERRKDQRMNLYCTPAYSTLEKYNFSFAVKWSVPKCTKFLN